MRTTLVKMVLGALVVAAGLAFSAGPAAAGGWAMTSLDVAPTPVAGRTEDVGFTIRQHGVSPVNPGEDVGISVQGADGATEFFPAEQDGATGHFVARVRIATPGTTTWKVRQGWFGPQHLGPVAVTPSATGAAASAVDDGTGSGYRMPLTFRVLLPVLGIGLGAFAIGDAIVARRRRARSLITT